MLTACVLVTAYAGSTLPWVRGEAGFDVVLDGGLGNGCYLATALLACWRAAHVAEDRKPWCWLAGGVAFWSGAEIYWTIALQPLAVQPFPSWADAGWLVFYPLAYVALVLLGRRRVTGMTVGTWLDGLMCGVGAATVTSAFLLRPVLGTLGGRFAAVAVNLAYPVGDLLLIVTVVVGMALLGGRRVAAAAVLISAGLLVFCLADVVYLIQVAHETYVSGRWLDAAWPVGLLLMTLAIGRPLAHEPRTARVRSTETRLIVPAAWMLGCIALLTVQQELHLHPLAVAGAAATGCLGILRLLMAHREVRLLSHHRVEARTDLLTGLPNRRALDERMVELLAPGSVGTALLLLDLDGFKSINDTFGHDAGDDLLVQVARRLEHTPYRDELVVRLGGDEFAVVLPHAGSTEAAATAAHILLDLSSPFILRGTGVQVSASIGGAVADGRQDLRRLLHHADLAMYDAKERGGGYRPFVADVPTAPARRRSVRG